jgi:hypothetical protein
MEKSANRISPMLLYRSVEHNSRRHGNTTLKQHGCHSLNIFYTLHINFVVLITYKMEYTGSSYNGEFNNGRYFCFCVRFWFIS